VQEVVEEEGDAEPCGLRGRCMVGGHG
jgi:hypothetical protein